MIPIRTLLACSLILAAAVGFAADDSLLSDSIPVEIECTFVEIPGADLEGLKFDSLLQQLNAPVTRQIRLSGDDFDRSVAANLTEVVPFRNANGDLRIFDPGQLQLALDSLRRKRGAYVFTTPMVIAKSDRPAKIEIIREFRRLPVDTPPQVSLTIPAEKPEADDGRVSTASSPLAFRHESRNLGFTLWVQPVVLANGYTIQLNLRQQVVEFEGCVGSGSPVVSSFVDPTTGISMRHILTPNLRRRPIFSTRKVTASASVYDCSTALFDGFLTEDVPKRVGKEDLLLHSLPILGPSFPSAPGQHTQSRLVLFVTARLISAGSGPVGANDEKEEVIDARTIVPSAKELPLMPK